MAIVLIASLFGAISPASAALPDDTYQPTWGVRGLGASDVSIGYRVRSMVTIGNVVYVAGRFTSVVAPDGSSRNQSYLAAFNATSGEWISDFNPTIDRPVHALAASADGSTLFAGGEFKTVNGASQVGLVALNPINGATKAGFSVSFGPTAQGAARVMALETAGDQLLVGGEWNKINDQNQKRAARLNSTTGALDTSFDPVVLGGQVLTIEHSERDGRVYLGGQFHSVDGNSDLRYFAALNSAGTPVAQPLFDDPAVFRSPENFNGYAILEVGDTVFVGARGNVLFVLDRATLNRKWHWGPQDNAFNLARSWHSSDFQALALFDGSVYAGTHIRWIGQPGLNIGNGIVDSRNGRGRPANVLLRFDPSGNHDEGFLPMDLKGSVWALTDAGNGCLWLGGNFGIPGRADWNLTRMCDTVPAPAGQSHAPFWNTRKMITQQYLDIHGRTPTPAEVNVQLAAGAANVGSSGATIDRVMRTSEAETSRQVARIYLGLFGRLPDQGGLQYWIGQRRNGLSLDAMVGEFLGSPEFANLVGQVDNRDFATEVYRRVLDREPDRAGLDYWENLLNHGLSRISLVTYFTESLEYRISSRNQVTVVLTYSSMLRRMPTAAENSTWLSRLRNGTTGGDLAAAIYSTSEYRSRVLRLPTSRP